MKKIFTPFLLMLLMLVWAPQANAQRFYQHGTEPVAEITVGQNYCLSSPWTGFFLKGTGGTEDTGILIEDAVYQFEEAGADADQNTLYRLKQISTGKYLEDPDLSKGVINMTEAVARAYVFTAKVGTGMAATYNNENGQNVKGEGWNAFLDQIEQDPRAVYDNKSLDGYTNAFLLCNKNYATTGWKVLCMFQGPAWDQWAAERIFHIFEATKASAYDDLCQALPYMFPNGVEGLFVAGTNPGQVPADLIAALSAAYAKAEELMNVEGQADEVYHGAIDELKKAYQACQDAFVPVTEGYYVIDNNPAGGRPGYAGTSNACMYEANGELHWAGFNKPDTMTVEGAAYIWQVIPAENGGWYLRNYGTKRYAGSLSANYQCVPSSEEAKQVYEINFRGGEFFSLDMRGQNATYPSLHADQNAGLKIVIWEPFGAASQWKFIPVDESELQGIESELAQAELNKNTKSLVSDVKAALSRGLYYSSTATEDGLYQEDNMGLVTAPEQYFSYTPEPTEGLLADNGLLDNNQTTIFHSCWSTAEFKNIPHNLCADLTNEYTAIAVKYSRRNKGNSGCAKIVHVYATNDTTGGNWKEQGFMTLTYPYASNETYTEEVANFTGIASVGFDAAYRFVRFDVEHTYDDATAQSGIYFNFSEFRVYEAKYDPSKSLIEAVPKELVAELKATLEQTEQELASGNVSQATYERLESIYKAFVENFPDPQVVKDLITEALAQADGAEEGEDLGYFETGAAEALRTVAEEVQATVKDVMTVQEIRLAKEKLEAALAEFNTKLIMPENNLFCYIKCATTSTQEGSALDSYLYAVNNDEGQVKYAVCEDFTARPNFLWKTVKHDDGSYSFMNCATGTYLGNPKKNNVRVNMSIEADSLTLRSAKVGGIFNIVVADNVFYNAQPGTNNLVTWNSANGTDNSAFYIEPISYAMTYWDNASINFPVSAQPEVISFAFNITGSATGGKLYKVLGVNEGLLQLKAYTEDEIIPGGTPFIFVPTPGAEGNVFFKDDTNMEDMTYTLEGLEQNGLHATLQTTKDITGGGILFNGEVILATESDVSYANSGYFESIPETTEVGDYTMKIPATLVSGIDELVANPNAQAGVYSLTGVKVRNNGNVQGLPKGVYVVGKHKVLVK